jgi:hypothetical protein
MATPLQIFYPNGQTEAVQVYIWDVATLQPKIWDGSVTGGGGGGGAVTIADGADVAQGTTTDATWSGSGSGTVVSILKKIATGFSGAVTIADGADTAEGATTDVAVTDDNPGTISAKLRNLNKLITLNLDVPLSTRLKPADTLAGVTTVGSITNPVSIAGTVPVSGTVTANQGTAAVVGNAWPIEVTDGTTVTTVKPATTAPVSTDKALVVTLHPFSPTPLQSFSTVPFAALVGLNTTSLLTISGSAVGPSSTVNITVTSLGNPANNLVFEVQCSDTVFRTMPLLVLTGSLAGQWVDGSNLRDNTVYQFNASAFPNVRVRVNQYGGGQVFGDWCFYPNGTAASKVNQTFGFIAPSAIPFVPGTSQPPSMTTAAKLRVESSLEEMIDFFGDFDLSLTQNLNITEMGNLI